MSDLQDHWNRAYATKAETAVSWYQPHLAISSELIRASATTHAGIIDIGGGASTLAEDLLRDGHRDVSVLDISENALKKTQDRLGDAAGAINWIAADIVAWSPRRTWDVWHDRAVFHFLTGAAAQESYVAALRAGTHPGSTAIIATFALDGPERCSGLPVQRYGVRELAARIGLPFVLIDQRAEQHRTPAGAIQSFIYVALRRES